MRVIRNYILAPPFVIEAPSNFKFLYAALVPTDQRDEAQNLICAICIFAEVDEMYPIIRHGFNVVGPNQAIPDNSGDYLGYVMLPYNQGVLHIYPDTSIVGTEGN